LEQWELKKNDTEMKKGDHHKRCRVCREVEYNKSNCPQVPQQPNPQSSQSTQPPPPSSQQSTQPTQQAHEVSLQTGQPSTRQKFHIWRPT